MAAKSTRKSSNSDRLPREVASIIGREEDIQRVMEAVQTETSDAVLITGGPGFGKTTVASKVAHELVKPEYKKSVYFCHLRSKTTINDGAMSMLLACSENLAQPPEAPQHWLLNWCKQPLKNVIFVLDNADQILDADDHGAFLNFLHEISTYSKQNVTFIVTSRQTFNIPDMNVANIRLRPLSLDAARQMLISRVAKPEIRQNLIKVDKLAELGGNVPLALCIVAPLLSEEHYTEDTLIECLQQEPSVVLQKDRRSTDQTSVERSVMRSFEVLHQSEKQALIRLCSFPGSFNVEAAESVISALSLSKAQSVSVLKELTNRSLVEEIGSQRYQIHQLIRQILLEKAGKESEFSNSLDLGNKLARAYFISSLAKNAHVYWGYNTSKQAIVSFNEDRLNFEFFLQDYIQQMKTNSNPEDEDLKTKNLLLNNLLQNCLYLEKCVLPSFYRKFLENCLSFIESSIHDQAIPTVELLCLLGHENRKVAVKYEECMKKAKMIYSKNHSKFNESPVSKVFFLNSDARYLSEKRNNKMAEEQTKQSLKVCKEQLSDHPEKATTFLYAGRLANRRKDFRAAMNKFKVALDLFSKQLGEHPMTAECLKNIADFYLGLQQRRITIDADIRVLSMEPEAIPRDGLNKSHKYYAKALTMMEKLGMDDNKDIFLILKNFAICQKRRGDLKGATDLLERGENVIAKAKLREDHMWNIMLKIQWAFLLKEQHKRGKEGCEEKAIVSMKEGLEMAKRLGKSMSDLNNKYEVCVFIADYPEEFPENRFPWSTKKAAAYSYTDSWARFPSFPL